MKNQKGFTLIEGLLILVIVGILGFTGWYVWRAKDNADKTYTASESMPTKSSNPYAGWIVYLDKNFKFSLSHPEGYTVNKACVYSDVCKSPDYDSIEVHKTAVPSEAPIFYVQFIKGLNVLTKSSVSENMGTGYGSALDVYRGKVSGKEGYIARINNGNGQYDYVYYVQNSNDQTLRLLSDSLIGEKIYATFNPL